MLCQDRIASDLVVLIFAGGPVETLQYELFGHAGKRAGLAHLISPQKSAISACQSKLLSLSESFESVETSPWILLGQLPGQFACDELRKRGSTFFSLALGFSMFSSCECLVHLTAWQLHCVLMSCLSMSSLQCCGNSSPFHWIAFRSCRECCGNSTLRQLSCCSRHRLFCMHGWSR